MCCSSVTQNVSFQEAIPCCFHRPFLEGATRGLLNDVARRAWEMSSTKRESPDFGTIVPASCGGHNVGRPKFLTSPRYNKQQGCIRWRISGQRPLKVEVYKNGLQIHSFTYTEKGSVLSLHNSSRRRCGQYEIQVSNAFGAVKQRLEIRREHLN
ncbi:hypothetical protein HOLleu_26636 [Holothuria leucospilota]|uniref:Uncharacterized protein n=1 Tax=Holothuria leucospilota TaxID=206669 RepID=A0A9Q1H2Z5_HOLLE|nr:hypothetical protein HOLleu_26636 [Holothuria leucospilota]